MEGLKPWWAKMLAPMSLGIVMLEFKGGLFRSLGQVGTWQSSPDEGWQSESMTPFCRLPCSASNFCAVSSRLRRCHIVEGGILWSDVKHYMFQPLFWRWSMHAVINGRYFSNYGDTDTDESKRTGWDSSCMFDHVHFLIFKDIPSMCSLHHLACVPLPLSNTCCSILAISLWGGLPPYCLSFGEERGFRSS